MNNKQMVEKVIPMGFLLFLLLLLMSCNTPRIIVKAKTQWTEFFYAGIYGKILF